MYMWALSYYFDHRVAAFGQVAPRDRGIYGQWSRGRGNGMILDEDILDEDLPTPPQQEGCRPIQGSMVYSDPREAVDQRGLVR